MIYLRNNSANRSRPDVPPRPPIGTFGRFLFCLFLTLLGLAFPQSARAQFIGYTSPQTATQTFSAASPCSASPGTTNTFNVSNLGQNTHSVQFLVSLATVNNLRVALQGSNDGTNFSDFSIAQSSTVGNGTVGFLQNSGYYPVIRIRATCIGSGAGTLTINYSGTSATTVPQNGPVSLTPEIIGLTNGDSSGTTKGYIISTPFGNAAGTINYSSTLGAPVGSILSACVFVDNVGCVDLMKIPIDNLAVQTAIPVPPYPASQIQVTYLAGGASAGVNTISYGFESPANNLVNASVQPMWALTATFPGTYNSETTSAVNTAITKSLALSLTGTARIVLFSVSARCSAGTAQLQVKDGLAGTVIWSTGATEIGTSTFRFQWNPGLASSLSRGMDVVLSACGVGNTGVLDIQASQVTF